jgi:hypothetical protein
VIPDNWAEALDQAVEDVPLTERGPAHGGEPLTERPLEPELATEATGREDLDPVDLLEDAVR